MWKKVGGFRCFSNNKQVFWSFGEYESRKGVKDKNLMGNLSALGVQWDSDTDKLEFKVTLKQNSRTRRHLLSIISSVYDHLELSAPFLLQGDRINQHLFKKIGLN